MAAGYLEQYYQAMDKVLQSIRSTQQTVILEAAEMIAASLAQRGAWLVMDTGHMLKHEAYYRAGGMMAIAPFSYGLTVENPLDQRQAARSKEEEAAIEQKMVSLALDSSKLKVGDVILINSNSGRTSNVIEVAIQGRERGIKTIGMASVAQMTQCEAAHPSGKKLFDVVDLAIDNCGPFGDAMLEVTDNEKMCPASGIAAAYIFWAIHAETVDRLQQRGVNPVIFRSVHVSGQGYIDEQRKTFIAQGV